MVEAAGYHAYVCPKAHAGVALLVRQQLSPCIRNVMRREEDGRCIGVEMQRQGASILVVCAYMPSGLDFVAEDDDRMQQAQSVYASIIRWSQRCRAVIVAGDLNETMTDLDRSHNSSRSRPGRLAHQLAGIGLVDVYRHMHPSEPGYTHSTASSVRPGESVHARLDYLLMRGWTTTALQHCTIEPDHPISHHRLVHMLVQLDQSMRVTAKPVPVRVPNLRHATEQQRAHLVQRVEHELSSMRPWLTARLAADSRSGIDDYADQLTSMVHAAATTELGLTGSRKWRHSSTDHLERQRKQLTGLLRAVETDLHHAPTDSPCPPTITRMLNRCNRSLPSPLPDPTIDRTDFIQQCRQSIIEVRKQYRRARVRLLASRPSDPWSNPAAAVHRMMRQDQSQTLRSVISDAGELLTEPNDIKHMLYSGFASIFDSNHCPQTSKATASERAMAASRPPSTGPMPSWYDQVYRQPRSAIDPAWYQPLMQPVDTTEMLEVASSCPYYAAPGHDGVSAGIWRLLAEKSPATCTSMAALLSSCLRLRTMPVLGKLSIIVPIAKKANQPVTMSNIRPISLQSALTKLLSKLLAMRLARILARHRILHPAQEAFIRNGAISNCIDTWLDVWEMSREVRTGRTAVHGDCVNLFYDIRAAYDSVQHDDLLRSLHRLHMPTAFIELIADSVSDLTSRVRTCYGLTDAFPVRRSVRQGDPLAPLLYVLFMDSLHAGMEVNPLQQYECNRVDPCSPGMGKG